MASIEIKNIDKTIDRLKWRRGAARAMWPAVKHIYAKIRPYPPPKAGSMYIRTGLLGSNWGVKVTLSDLTGTISNYATPYAPFVQGSLQTAMHAGTGWKRTDNVAADETAVIARIFMKQINKILAGGR